MPKLIRKTLEESTNAERLHELAGISDTIYPLPIPVSEIYSDIARFILALDAGSFDPVMLITFCEW